MSAPPKPPKRKYPMTPTELQAAAWRAIRKAMDSSRETLRAMKSPPTV